MAWHSGQQCAKGDVGFTAHGVSVGISRMEPVSGARLCPLSLLRTSAVSFEVGLVGCWSVVKLERPLVKIGSSSGPCTKGPG